MSSKELHVAIAGGGLGGLCLAQGLKRAGLQVSVFERDASPDARTQGYRIHISPEGSEALHACLPPKLWGLFEVTGGAQMHGFTVMTEQMQELLSLGHGGKPDPVRRHRSISRVTLRRVLLSGLEEDTHWGRRFARYEVLENGRVRLHFEAGEPVEADVLVGADGVHSRVRQQRLPGADPVEAGVVGIGGAIPLTEKTLAMVPPPLLEGPVMVLPPAACSLFVAAWRRPQGADEILRELGLEEALEPDYLLCALGGKPEYFGLDGKVESVSGKTLKVVMRAAMQAWHPALRELVERLDEEQIFLNRLRTSRPQPAWTPSRVTLLGDAIHSMTPYRGTGGNIALKDAQVLCGALTRAARGEQPLLEAIGEYEAAMRGYGFAAVGDSRRAMEQFTGPKQGLGFAAMKAGMRTVNAALKLRRGVA
uniref:FAD-dependent monooxygenase n=1 Tax=Acidobacterium capsulatum TaxID=33075 RepID=A0A7V5CS69_9BACT